MKYTGDKAIRLAEKYGLPIQKRVDAHEGYRADVPLEDAQWVAIHGDPDSIFVEAEPALADAVSDDNSD